MDRPDGWLLREWKSGNERAAEVLFDRYAIRLVALVASRLNRRYRSSIDPDEVVQSAMGSFFDAAKHSRVQVSSNVSLWRLLATFARRKMARSIETHATLKRGGNWSHVTLEEASMRTANEQESYCDDGAEAFVENLKAELSNEQFAIVEGVLAGQTQREIADSLEIDERTVRRRLSRVREKLGQEYAAGKSTTREISGQPALPRVGYNEFVLGKLIGSGGFGKVYHARMQSGDRGVAVKFLRKTYWQNDPARHSFLREINIASQIHHPGIIRYIGHGESPHGGPYVISEWIDGRPMRALDRVTATQFIGWLLQICETLEEVHQAGLVHGDLTPSNVLVDSHDRITITDFGFSQASDSGPTSVLGGTLGFAAPEQIDPSFGAIGIPTDLHAIGGLVHWHLFKQPPQFGASAVEMMSRTLHSEERFFRPPTGVPPALHQIMEATLAPAPADRKITLTQITNLLRGAIHSGHTIESLGK
ncbi:protein kinase domain-containing protein [Rhodopirellula bahusiensis]|uniref:protein kinase domain-containing protein n=1 Tax=Rhodopirellula bahusiensis TaxID=2014065 RepID=UPI003263C217